MPAWLRDDTGGVLVDVLVQPRASRTRIVGEHGDRLKIQVAAPPVGGEANAELCRHLASLLGVPRRDVTVQSGESGRRKTLRIAGLDLSAALRVLGA